MNKIENQFTSIQQVTDRYLNANSSSAAKGTSDVSFEEILSAGKHYQPETGCIRSF